MTDHNVEEIHYEAVRTARGFLSKQVELIDVLVRVIRHRVSDIKGYSNLYEYCELALGLSKDVAYVLLAIAKKSIQVPEIKSLVDEGKISVSNARCIAPHLTNENKELWLEKAQSLSQKALQQEIVKKFPEAKVVERIKPVAEKLHSMVILLDDEGLAEWQRFREVMLQKNRGAVSNSAVLAAACKAGLEKHDPVRKAQRAQVRSQKVAASSPSSSSPTCTSPTLTAPRSTPPTSSRPTSTRPTSTRPTSTRPTSTRPTPTPPTPRVPHSFGARRRPSNTASRRLPIPAAAIHQVNLRDKGQCRHLLPGGMRCQSKTFLEIHHRVPLAMGGTHAVENLITLCSAHHRYQHRNNLPMRPVPIFSQR